MRLAVRLPHSAPTLSIMDMLPDQLTKFVEGCERLVVLTGAGISTGSGIPDYRGPDGAWKRRQPIRFQEFVAWPLARRRYWARSFVGWPQIDSARPNAAHIALAELQGRGLVSALITQNVDGLHARAGSRATALHGDLAQVRCLDCGAMSSRAELQLRLQGLNPGWQSASADRMAPDGDADLDDANYADFELADCVECGGMLKPDVVFFGEMVPPERVQRCMREVECADGLLVAGSSLMVFSGFRFARAAHAAGIPVVAINKGQTRADDLLTLKAEMDVGPCLQALAARLRARVPAVDAAGS